jgi:hypothetical protein
LASEPAEEELLPLVSCLRVPTPEMLLIQESDSTRGVLCAHRASGKVVTTETEQNMATYIISTLLLSLNRITIAAPLVLAFPEMGSE